MRVHSATSLPAILAVAIGAAAGPWPLPAVAQPAIQKCVDSAGKITYQDAPCDSRQKVAGKVERDTSKADPVAVQRAADERLRAADAAKARSKAAFDEELREASPSDLQPTPAAPSAKAEPRYLYLPRPIVVTLLGAKDITNARSSGTMTVPGIMPSPASCNTPNCRKK